MLFDGDYAWPWLGTRKPEHRLCVTIYLKHMSEGNTGKLDDVTQFRLLRSKSSLRMLFDFVN